MASVYHSVPKDLFMHPAYLNLLRYKFGATPDLKHILDCPESNIPVLSRSKATYLTDTIKQICPLLFPIKPYSLEETINKMNLAS